MTRRFAILGLSIVAVFFGVPSALRRIEPSFRLTALRLSIAIGTLVVVGRFMTTLGVVTASLALFVPAARALLGLWIRGASEPRSLLVTAPLVLLLPVYCECVRYMLIVRWYRRLANGAPRPAP